VHQKAVVHCCSLKPAQLSPITSIGVIRGVGSGLNQMPPMPSTADYERDPHVASSVEKLFLYAVDEIYRSSAHAPIAGAPAVERKLD
jgi:hypothetical protein